MATSVAAVIREHQDCLLARPGVVGLAEGEHEGAPCIVIFVAAAPAPADLPATLGGYPVRVEESGEIRALDDQGLG